MDNEYVRCGSDMPCTVASALRARVQELEGGLEFYADPATYFAIGFFPDPPCGDFLDDFEDTELGRKPGKLARALLDAPTKEVMPHQRDTGPAQDSTGPAQQDSTPAPVVTSAAGAAFMLPEPKPATPIPPDLRARVQELEEQLDEIARSELAQVTARDAVVEAAEFLVMLPAGVSSEEATERYEALVRAVRALRAAERQ